MPTIDFLSRPSDKLIRREMKNIRDSYSHPWDVLAEILQNSVDAIRRFGRTFPEVKKEHRIDIRIDATAQSLSVRDSGVGFPIKDLAGLLSPHGTDKDDATDEIGEKGIGLKFAMFSCDKLTLESQSAEGRVLGTVTGGLTWVQRGIGKTPMFEASELSETTYVPQATFCRVSLEQVENVGSGPDSIFEMNTNRLQHLLRTKTAVGNTRAIFEVEDVKPTVTLEHVDPNGQTWKVGVPFRYRTPLELVAVDDQRDLKAFVERAAAMDDRQKARELQNKTLYKVGSVLRAGRTIRYLACFVPSRDTWGELSKRIDPVIGALEGSEANGEPLLSGGIYLSTKGMPTGIGIVPPPTGAAGYWPNTLILIEDDRLEFDLGRKSVPGKTQSMFKEISRDLFNDFTRYTQYISGSSAVRVAPTIVYEQEKQKTFDALERLTDLGLTSINYLKYPDAQEAAVVAIFHELVAAGLLPGYYGLRQGYKAMYDLWARYRMSPDKLGAKARAAVGDKVDVGIVVEFKYECAAVIPDVQGNRKFFEDIDLIVCWTLDERRFAKENIKVRPMPPDEVFFYGSNYVLEWPGAYNLGNRGVKPVLALKSFVEELVRNE